MTKVIVELSEKELLMISQVMSKIQSGTVHNVRRSDAIKYLIYETAGSTYTVPSRTRASRTEKTKTSPKRRGRPSKAAN